VANKGRREPAENIEFADFTKAVKKVLDVPKQESDAQMAHLQASNKMKHEAREPRQQAPKPEATEASILLPIGG
jgi:hypothetical protein